MRVEGYGSRGRVPGLAVVVAFCAGAFFGRALQRCRRGAAHDGLGGGRGGVFVEVGDLVRFGQSELVADLHVAPAEHGGVDGQEDGFVAGSLGALDEFARVLALFEEVELQD